MATTIASPASKVTMTAQLSSGAAPATIGSSVNHTTSTAPAIGSTAGKVNKLYSAPLTVTTGTPLSIDLTALVDPFGAAVNIGVLTDIFISNDSATTGQDLTIGGGTNGVFAALPFPVEANSGEFKWSGRTGGITIDGTHKILTITVAAGTAVPFELSLWGR